MNKKKALVTGGSSGIGKSLCLKLASEGYEVFSASRSEQLPDDMPGIIQLPVDFSSSAQTVALAQKFLLDYGVPHLLVNNAGYGAFFEWGEFPENEITNQIEVLFSAPVRLIRIFAPAMQKEGRGIILNLSSLATLYPLPYMPLYNAGKSALSSFTESMGLEYSQFPKFIDFRMGDVRTNFNAASSKQIHLNENLNAAWKQIDKQLKNSISSDEGVNQVYQSISNMHSGTIYGGGFLHRCILPVLKNILPNSLKTQIIKSWYNLRDV